MGGSGRGVKVGVEVGDGVKVSVAVKVGTRVRVGVAEGAGYVTEQAERIKASRERIIFFMAIFYSLPIS